MDLLNLLSTLLTQASSNSPVEIKKNGDIDKVLLQLQSNFRSGGRNNEPKDLQLEAVKRFWSSAKIETLREARLVSFGLTIRPFDDKRCLMEDKNLFGSALEGIDAWQAAPRQYRKCYQGLVRSYFDYDGLGRNVHATGKANWSTLRDYLNKNTSKIRDESLNPDWVSCALSNEELFTASPCDGYAGEITNGLSEQVKEIRDLLGISDASWFTRELTLAQIRKATELDDKRFYALVTSLLNLLGNNEVLRDRGLQILLNRFIQIQNPPQHNELKNYAVACWGNPWLPSNQDRWGGVDSAARLMISNWLKLEFIELFFTKLAQDGLSDTRRVKFWAKYVPAIEEIHFALGIHAMTSRERDFVEIREKLKGLIVEFQDNNVRNNAFIMRMGDLMAVEFSGASNAFYGYSVSRRLPFDLTRTLYTPVDGHNSLKNSSKQLYLRHQDNVLGYADWEGRFENELKSKFKIRPGVAITQKTSPIPQWKDEIVTPIQTQPYQVETVRNQNDSKKSVTSKVDSKVDQALSSYLKKGYSLDNVYEFSSLIGGTVQDRSGKGGALWVLFHSNTPTIKKIFTNWEFSYVKDKGWWKKI